MWVLVFGLLNTPGVEVTVSFETEAGCDEAEQMIIKEEHMNLVSNCFYREDPV